jgi:sulfide dehydrogenase cytochrome subunit
MGGSYTPLSARKISLRNRVLLSALAVAPFLLVTKAGAAEVDALMQTCSACHSVNGIPPSSDIPIIAGQPFSVIEDALILFADGQRPCSAMCAIAAALNPLEKEALANYLEQQTFAPATQQFELELAALGAKLHHNNGCETCHSQGGRNGNGMAPILAGQRTPYLRNALFQIKTGKRSGPQVMNQAIRSLSDDEIEALLNFYALNGQQN